MTAPAKGGGVARIVSRVQCGCLSSLNRAGWGAFRVDDAEEGESSALALFRPACAERESGFGAD